VKATMNDPDNGLSTPGQVEALADQLATCADALHARLKREAASMASPPSDAPGDSAAWARRHAALEALFDDEQVLRQRANSLYADAAITIVRGLGKPQQHVLALTSAAAEQIRKIGLLSDAAGLVAGLLALAGAVASAQPTPVLAALETVRVQLKAVKAGLQH
jgi:hypothetical protein